LALSVVGMEELNSKKSFCSPLPPNQHDTSPHLSDALMDDSRTPRDSCLPEPCSQKMQGRISENLHRFFRSITPSFHRDAVFSVSEHKMTGDLDGSDRDAKDALRDFRLFDLWQFFDEPYGHEVPLVLEQRETEAYFVPYLSAVQLFHRSSSSLSDSDSDSDSLSEACAPAPAPFFEYFERASPSQRVPLIDKIRELSHYCSALTQSKASDLDQRRSWFCISWYPILCDLHTSRSLNGCFLTYHGFEVVGDCPLVPSLMSLDPIESPSLPLSSHGITSAFSSPLSCAASIETTSTDSICTPSHSSPSSSASSSGSEDESDCSVSSSTSMSSRSSRDHGSASPVDPMAVLTIGEHHLQHRGSGSSGAGSGGSKKKLLCSCGNPICLKPCPSFRLGGFGKSFSDDDSPFFVPLLGYVCHRVRDDTWFSRHSYSHSSGHSRHNSHSSHSSHTSFLGTIEDRDRDHELITHVDLIAPLSMLFASGKVLHSDYLHSTGRR